MLSSVKDLRGDEAADISNSTACQQDILRADETADISNRIACQQHCIVDAIDKGLLLYIQTPDRPPQELLLVSMS